MALLAALNFPPIGELVDWKKLRAPGFQQDGAAQRRSPWSSSLVFFFVAARKKQLVPTGAQNLAEATVDFIVDGIILQTIGPDGMAFLPFLLSLFTFIFISNIFEIIPLIQFPANARMANPLVLALIVWVAFLYRGLQDAGLSGLHAVDALSPGRAQGAATSWSLQSSSCRPSWSGRSRSPSGSSPTCSPATCCSSPSPC